MNACEVFAIEKRVKCVNTTMCWVSKSELHKGWSYWSVAFRS